MLSVERFVKLLRPHIEARTPFIAYLHPKGVAVLKVGAYMNDEYDVTLGTGAHTYKQHAKCDLERDRIIVDARRRGERIDSIRTVQKQRKTKVSTINGMRKAIAQMQKDPRCRPLYIVEFDGHSIASNGDDSDVIDNMILENAKT